MMDAEVARDTAAGPALLVKLDGGMAGFARMPVLVRQGSVDTLALMTAILLAAGRSTTPFDLAVRRAAVRAVYAQGTHIASS